MFPRIIIGNEIEKSNDEKRPAVVPPITLTRAKMIIVVRDPITAGNNIVNS